MRKPIRKKWLSLVLCIALLAAAALCNASLAETTVAEAQEPVILMTGTLDNPVIMGEGKVSFLFGVVNQEGAESYFKICTDADTVGAALLENGLIAGTESEYGLYVTSVCGTELIWSEENPCYWAFYINGEYAMTGVDSTPVEEGAAYLFKAEKS